MGMYLVTGAAGFIGAALSKKLIDENHRVITIDNLTTGFKKNIPEGVEFYEGDCQDLSIYQTIPQEKYDAIFHIAGQSSGEISFDDPIYDIRTNAESTLLLLKFALQNNCNRFIYAGTMSVYGVKPDRPVTESEETKPESFYGVGKLASEHYMRIYQQYGINSTSLRLFNVYGTGQNLENLRQGMVSIFLAQMLNKHHIHVKGSCERYRDFIHIDDVVEAFTRCLTKSESWGQIINVGTGVKTTVNELLETMIGIYQKEVTVEFSGNTAGDVHGIYADIRNMSSLLDFKPRVSLKNGLAKMIDWATINGESVNA